jgi:hypothetical protein
MSEPNIELPEPQGSPSGIRFSTAEAAGGDMRRDYTPEQVRELVRQAALAERERCARVCEDLVAIKADGTREDRYAATARACATAIRRG